MSSVADTLRRRVLSHTESSMTFTTNELLSLCEAIDNEVRKSQEKMRDRIENMPMPEKDWIGSLYEKGWKGGWRAYSAAISALEVEDG